MGLGAGSHLMDVLPACASRFVAEAPFLGGGGGPFAGDATP